MIEKFGRYLHVLCASSIVLVSCANNSRRDSSDVTSESESMSRTESDDMNKRALSPLVMYDAPQDTVFYDGPYSIDYYFGLESENCRIPDIPGLVFRSTPGRHLGVRCPKDKNVLKWVSYKVKRYADWCKSGPADTIPSTVPVYERPKSAEDICNHYFEIVYVPNLIRNLGDDDVLVIEQFAELLVDVFENRDYVTMQEATWYDCMSCGDNTTRSWFTIDKKTGRQLELSDIIQEDRMQDFAYLMIKHLNNWDSPWFDYARGVRMCDLQHYLDLRSGCALVKEGVVVYYHPYIMGCGAEGQFNSLVPYDELKGILKPGL